MRKAAPKERRARPRFAMELRIRRKAKGMSQKQLAQRLNVRQATIAVWERGLAKPSAEYVPRLAKVLGIDALELSRIMESVEPPPAATVV